MLNKSTRAMAVRRKNVAQTQRRRNEGMHPVMYGVMVGCGIILTAACFMAIMATPYIILELLKELP